MTNILSNKTIRSALQGGVALAALLAAAPVWAQVVSAGRASGDQAQQAPDGTLDNQQPAAEPSETEKTQDIIVTGTQIRGVAPAGSAAVNLNQTDIAATGATTTAQILANVPQLATFNTRPSQSGTQSASTVNRVNLRNLPGSSGGGSSTLILVDGHRMPGMGVRQTIPDPDAIAPGAIERIEIVPDGGSSIYGADAVGGVLNFITRRKFDGLQVSGRYGFTDNSYKSVNGTVTAGKTWGPASAYVSYDYERHDAVFGRDLNYVRRRDYQANLPQDLSCNPGNVISGSAIYALPGLTSGTGNRCDTSQSLAVFPRTERHSVYGGIAIDDGGPVSFNLRGFYTHRVNETDQGPLTASVTIAPVNVFTGALNTLYRNVDGTFGPQTVAFNLAPITGASNKGRVTLDTWQIAPTMSADLGSGFQLRTLFSYGRGISKVRTPLVDGGVLSNATLGAQLDPYNLSAPGNAAILAAATNYGENTRGINELVNTRVVVDGPLFALPGGDVRIAIGAEYLAEKYQVAAGVGAPGNETFTDGNANRRTAAIFGEAQIPLVSEANDIPLIRTLSASASGRYDDYSDFGGTFNPRFGLTYEPVKSLRLRGSWGKSFQAPSLADTAAAAGNSIIALPFVVFPSPLAGQAPTQGQAQIFLGGGGANLRPQKATTWTFGGEFTPAFADGLVIQAGYYNIKFSDLIDIPPVFNPSVFYRLFASAYIINPTAAQVAAFGAQAPGGAAAVAPYTAFNGQVYSIADGRRSNLASVKTDGLDLSVNYDRTVSFGTIYGRFNGTYVLTSRQAALAGATYTSTVHDQSREKFAATLGTTVGNLRVQGTVNYQGGFDTTPAVANLNQSRVSSYTLVNGYVEYEFNGHGVFKDLSLTATIENIFDQDPPAYNGTLSGDGYANGFTLGRLFQFGISKKF